MATAKSDLRGNLVKTLGICIPTYRRPALLKRCILSAIASAGTRPIEIVVADDSMSDINGEVLRELAASYSFVQWHRNGRNLGIDANIQQAVDLCNCDYAWLVGEDDFFLPNAVARVHDHIQLWDGPLVFANYRYSSDDPDQILGFALDKQLDGPIPRGEFIANHLWATGFIGSCVVQKAAWTQTQVSPYVGTYYTHVGRIVEMLADADVVSVVGEPCVANRVEGHETFTWKNDSYGVFFGFVAMCRRVAEQVPALSENMERASRGFEQKFRWLSLRLALRLRSEQAFDYRQFAKYIRDSEIGGFKRLMYFGISITPPGILKPLVRLYRVTRRRGAASIPSH